MVEIPTKLHLQLRQLLGLGVKELTHHDPDYSRWHFLLRCHEEGKTGLFSEGLEKRVSGFLRKPS